MDAFTEEDHLSRLEYLKQVYGDRIVDSEGLAREWGVGTVRLVAITGGSGPRSIRSISPGSGSPARCVPVSAGTALSRR